MMIIRRVKKFIQPTRESDSPICPYNTQIILFNKRLTLHRDFSQKTLQDAINELQIRLQDKKYLSTRSGRFDQETEQAVRKFQKEHDLVIDGVVGPLTWVCLCYPKLSRNHSKEVLPDVEAAIRELQTVLRAEGFRIKDDDGCFGDDTERAVKTFQSKYGLRVDGVVGAITWAVLLGMRQRLGETDANRFRTQSLSVFDQMLMVLSIVLGMYLHPNSAPAPSQVSNAIATAYALTYAVPVLLEKFPLRPLNQSNIPLLKYAPFICVGMFWNSIFKFLESLIEKLLLAT